MPKTTQAITHLFLDIGGVLLTNGWDHVSRNKAYATFKLDKAEVENRHRLTFELYEVRTLTLDEYLDQVIFYKKRSFTRAEFRTFMFSQSKPYPKMLALMKKIKADYGLKVIAVSNEALELNAHRIKKFHLDSLIDTFISSCYVQVRKPDIKIFQLALDVSQAPMKQVLYIENTPFFVELAEKFGIQSLLHTDYTSTCKKLASFGLSPN